MLMGGLSFFFFKCRYLASFSAKCNNTYISIYVYHINKTHCNLLYFIFLRNCFFTKLSQRSGET